MPWMNLTQRIHAPEIFEIQQRRIWLIVQTPHSHGCAVELIRKCIKNSEKKYTYWNLAKPGTCITCAPKVSWHTMFEGFNWKIYFRNAKNVTWKVPWSAIMHILNEVWCWYSTPSRILTQMTFITNIFEIQSKQFKLLSGHQTLMSKHPGSLRKA